MNNTYYYKRRNRNLRLVAKGEHTPTSHLTHTRVTSHTHVCFSPEFLLDKLEARNWRENHQSNHTMANVKLAPKLKTEVFFDVVSPYSW